MSNVDPAPMFPHFVREYRVVSPEGLKNASYLSEDRITRDDDQPRHTRPFENIAKSQAPPE